MSRMVTEQPRAVWCCSICGAVYYKDYPRCPADGGEVVISDRDPLLGSVVGHYTISRLVGEGGMGRVYLAQHVHLPNKRYALKVLLGDHAASVAMRTRFTREAERASQLEHPNVAKVVDFGQTRHGLLYIVMDYVDGPSLASVIERGPMPPEQVIALSRGICAGLGHAHTAGIVHRDLKPENILVAAGPDGPVPRIVDFGLALSVDQSDARLTETGMTMGTPAFAAPEQLSGKPLDQRADLYALGMTMFEMLTGGLAPIEGALLEVLSARAARDVPRISERAPHIMVPRALEDIVARLTRRRPLERFASAEEVVAALDQVNVASKSRWMAQVVASRWRVRRWLAAATEHERRGWLVGGAAAVCAGVAVAWFAASGDAGSPAASGAPAGASIEAAAGPRIAVAPTVAPAAVPPTPSALPPSGSPASAAGAASAAGSSSAVPASAAGAASAAGSPSAVPASAAGAASAAGSPSAVPASAAGAAGSPSAVPASAAGAASAAGSSSTMPGSVRAPAAPAGAPTSRSPATAAPSQPPPSRRPGASPSLAAAGQAGTAGKQAPAEPARRRNRPRTGRPGGRAEAGAVAAAETRRSGSASAASTGGPARPLRAEIASIDVAGSLPAGAVQRAIERRWAAIARCIPAVPEVVVARFTIGEARRAQDIRATGAAPGIGACITAALADVRTEAAPDVGDVQVTVRIAFVGKP